jgi:hypothetical protein
MGRSSDGASREIERPSGSRGTLQLPMNRTQKDQRYRTHERPSAEGLVSESFMWLSLEGAALCPDERPEVDVPLKPPARRADGETGGCHIEPTCGI